MPFSEEPDQRFYQEFFSGNCVTICKWTLTIDGISVSDGPITWRWKSYFTLSCAFYENLINPSLFISVRQRNKLTIRISRLFSIFVHHARSHLYTTRNLHKSPGKAELSGEETRTAHWWTSSTVLQWGRMEGLAIFSKSWAQWISSFIHLIPGAKIICLGTFHSISFHGLHDSSFSFPITPGYNQEEDFPF